ncbi:MAG: helix-turn-helix transcriptional regulator [Leptolyngbyaceae cyanobacterium]
MMAAPLKTNRFLDLFVAGHSDDPQLLHADPTDQILVCPPEIGKGYVQQINLRDDFMVIILDYTLTQDVLIDTVGPGDRIEFEFHLAGPDADYSLCVPCFRLRQVGIKRAQRRYFKVEVFFKRPTLIRYAQRFLERLLPHAQTTAERILQSLYRYQNGGSSLATDTMLDQVFNPRSSKSQATTSPLLTLDPSMEQLLNEPLHAELLTLEYAMRSPITPAMAYIIDQILSCPYQGVSRHADLQRHALKLVDLRLDAILHLPLDEVDISCVFQAATLLRSQLANPPSLETLARQVGTNRLTLTQNFRKLYGTTPFGYLRDFRLMRARRLLMTSELSINEIAAAVGYTSRSRFAAAFRQRTGFNPKAFQLQTG